MNIKDLPVGSYTVVTPQKKATSTPVVASSTPKKLNIKDLDPADVKVYTGHESSVSPLVKATDISATGDPTFKYNPNDSLLGWNGLKTIGNVPSSLWGLGKGIVSAVAHPINTVKSVANLVAGTAGAGAQYAIDHTELGQSFLKEANKVRAQNGAPLLEADAEGKLHAPDNEQTMSAKAVGNYFKERYGGAENLKKTLTEDPAGIALDLSMILDGGASIAGKTAKLAEVADLGKTASTINKASEIAKTTSKVVNPINKVTGGLGKLLNKIGDSRPSFSVANDAIVGGKVSPETQAILNPSKNIGTVKTGGIKFTVPNFDGVKVGETVPAFIEKGGAELTAKEGSYLADHNTTKYNKFLNESKANLANPENPSPLNGSITKSIGDHVDAIDAMRMKLGKAMGEVEKNFADHSSPLHEKVMKGIDDIENNLADHEMLGLKGGNAEHLKQFVENVKNLDNDPSLANRNRIIRHWNTIVEDSRDTAGKLTDTYRQISVVLKDLKNDSRSIVPDAGYQDMFKKYSEYKNFSEEAYRVLGGDTIMGNLKKGASVAKRAVQSLADGGSRDFLLKLKEMTGYNAIQDARIAIQAMKDAGDFKQASLLENTMKGLISGETGIPLSKSGVINKVLDTVVGAPVRYGMEKFVGEVPKRVEQYINDTHAPTIKERMQGGLDTLLGNKKGK